MYTQLFGPILWAHPDEEDSLFDVAAPGLGDLTAVLRVEGSSNKIAGRRPNCRPAGRRKTNV